MLEGKDYSALDIFPFVLDMLTLAQGFKMTPLSTISTFSSLLWSTNYCLKTIAHIFSIANVDEMRVWVKMFRTSVWPLFGPHFQQVLHKLAFHFLGSMFDDLDFFGPVIVLNYPTCSHFNLILKQSYSCSLKRLKTRTVATVGDTYMPLISRKRFWLMFGALIFLLLPCAVQV